MAHSRLILLTPLFAGLLFSACVSQKQSAVIEPNHQTFLKTKIPPSGLVLLSERFLEWQKGFGILVRDHQQGLLVTDWIQNYPNIRSRVTLRSMKDTEGSIVSVHYETEIFAANHWMSTVSDGTNEAKLLKELDSYIKAAPQAAGRNDFSNLPQNRSETLTK